MKGFLSGSEIHTSEPVGLVPKCGSCGLLKLCQSPKMPVSGEGRRFILIVGEAPGQDEDSQNIQFVGVTGQLLIQTLKKLGVEKPRRDCWFTNALICHPPDNKIRDDRMVDYCRPNLINTINQLKPEIIILLGAVAVDSLIGYLWKKDTGGIYRWVGWQIPSQKLNAWVCPTFHPSHISRATKDKQVLTMHFESHLKLALKLRGRPFDYVPNYPSQITVCLDDAKVARFLQNVVKDGGPVAFDYEFSPLKPDNDTGYIRCASVCWRGKTTLAFPWYGEAIKAMRRLLRSPNLKIASNIRCEERWSRKVLNTRVRNWWWDTMLGAHVLDNRKGITGIKFQAFVLLGQPPWNQHIEPFLGADTSLTHNKIKEVGLEDLLLYCGTDSLLEYLVAEIQMKQIGYPLP